MKDDNQGRGDREDSGDIYLILALVLCLIAAARWLL